MKRVAALLLALVSGLMSWSCAPNDIPQTVHQSATTVTGTSLGCVVLDETNARAIGR
jgi:hypothetical protein